MTKSFRIEEVGDELILWDDGPPLQANVLDRVQARIYRLATDGKSLDHIEEVLRETFRIAPGQDLRPMLISYLRQFVEQELIDPTAPAAEFPIDWKEERD
jgi:hypothetical protein